MKWMKQVFAQRFNAADGRTGHIWGDRYGSRILEGEPVERGAVEAGAAINRDRPRRLESEGAARFSRIFPHPSTLSPG
jgi:hypothetical protein